ncbi:MAG: DNA-3-methyladenine glycosylase [Bdellovibrionota bacterium]
MGNLLTSLYVNASGKVSRVPSVVSEKFYTRNTLTVAHDLLGKILLVKSGRKEAGVFTAARIVETEAYCGNDPASHASRGRTPRNSVMFGKPGVAYVYFIYGMYEMLNFVTEEPGVPGAVLIRSAEPLAGEELMKRRRKTKTLSKLTNGPGKLCKAMGINMRHNKKSLLGPEVIVCDDGFRPKDIFVSERVGISVGKENLWRFFMAENPFISSVKENAGGMPVSASQLLKDRSGFESHGDTVYT